MSQGMCVSGHTRQRIAGLCHAWAQWRFVLIWASATLKPPCVTYDQRKCHDDTDNVLQ